MSFTSLQADFARVANKAVVQLIHSSNIVTDNETINDNLQVSRINGKIPSFDVGNETATGMYFVATNGDDVLGTGSIASPLQTITQALTMPLVNGQLTIFILDAGVYYCASSISPTTAGTYTIFAPFASIGTNTIASLVVVNDNVNIKITAQTLFNSSPYLGSTIVSTNINTTTGRLFVEADYIIGSITNMGAIIVIKCYTITGDVTVNGPSGLLGNTIVDVVTNIGGNISVAGNDAARINVQSVTGDVTCDGTFTNSQPYLTLYADYIAGDMTGPTVDITYGTFISQVTSVFNFSPGSGPIDAPYSNNLGAASIMPPPPYFPS